MKHLYIEINSKTCEKGCPQSSHLFYTQDYLRFRLKHLELSWILTHKWHPSLVNLIFFIQFMTYILILFIFL